LIDLAQEVDLPSRSSMLVLPICLAHDRGPQAIDAWRIDLDMQPPSSGSSA
jgi:hypothetical protein